MSSGEITMKHARRLNVTLNQLLPGIAILREFTMVFVAPFKCGSFDKNSKTHTYPLDIALYTNEYQLHVLTGLRHLRKVKLVGQSRASEESKGEDKAFRLRAISNRTRQVKNNFTALGREVDVHVRLQYSYNGSDFREREEEVM